MGHEVPVRGPGAWGYNGDPQNPTFTPSVKVTWEHGEAREPRCCHSIITSGEIHFQGDCTHKLSGQKVPMIDWPAVHEGAV
jgi:hypothetical protein